MIVVVLITYDKQSSFYIDTIQLSLSDVYINSSNSTSSLSDVYINSSNSTSSLSDVYINSLNSTSSLSDVYINWYMHCCMYDTTCL